MSLEYTAEIRNKADKLKEKAVFEVDLVSGEIKWLNKYALSILGYNIDQITRMKIEDITPEEMREALQEEMADKASGKEPKFSIWPAKATNNKLIWFYVYQTRTHHPIHWMQAEVVQTTENNGPAYVFMRMQMEVASQFVSVEAKIEDLDKFVKSEFRNIYEKHDYYDKLLEGLVVTVDKTGHSAERAANAAISAVTRMEQTEIFVKDKLSDFETKIEDQNTNQTKEILRIIKEESLTKKRMDDFEKNVKMTTDLAIKSIVGQADKAGKDLSKKVTIPVSLITVAAAIVQFIIQYFSN